MTYKVLIDGVEDTLTYDRESGARGRQYLTNNNRASHAFSFKLEPGQKFRTNGHNYEVLGAL